MNQGSYDLRRDVDRLKNKTDELAKDYYIEVNSTIVTYKDEVYTPSTIVATAYQSSREITDFYDDGKTKVPYLKIEPVSVTEENIDDVIIKSGFHLKEDVYLNVPSKMPE